MGERHRVRLTTSNTFDLERDEIKRLYTYLSLFQYRHLRVPNYSERTLIETLEKGFRKFVVEMQSQTERDPDAISSGNSATISHGQRQHLQPPQPSLQPQYEEHHTQSYSDESSSGALSLFDIPSSGSGADQDDIDNAEMAKNLQQKKKRRGMRM